jgi:hypothetical protein
MKFYLDTKYDTYYYDYIFAISNNITAIYSNSKIIFFYKNGKFHNTKNAAYIYNRRKSFRFNNTWYGNQNDFTKESWRRFVKLQVFL